ncbi:hypothetical protein F4779DRAFT_580245 [Xylariaceae sp. FL0662B]|nr:hypothetical protein F4779DRAFT_580245 [Xylariaceae sp. FL0662B]
MQFRTSFAAVVALLAHCVAAVDSPEEMIFLSGVGVSAWSTLAWSLCELQRGHGVSPRGCISVAIEVGAFTSVAVPHYFWGDEEWKIVKERLGKVGYWMIS